MQALEAGRTALDIIAKPAAWEDAVARWVIRCPSPSHVAHTVIHSAMASNILTAVYGWPRMSTSSEDMALVKRIHAHVEHISDAAIPGKFLVDVFPVLKYLPAWMAKWKRDGEAWFENESRMFAKFTASVRDKMVREPWRVTYANA